MEELVNKIKAEFEAFATDANLQIEKANKAAGTRARKSSLDLEKLLKEFRKVSVEESKKKYLFSSQQLKLSFIGKAFFVFLTRCSLHTT